MDEKRLRGEEEHIITQGEIDAWRRGEQDAARDKLLQASKSMSVKKAIALVKMYAELGDLHYLTTRFDIKIDEARRVLAAFGINSIEDAKAAVRSGVIAEYDSAKAEADAESEAERRSGHAEAEERLLERTRQREETPRDPAEVDAELRERAAEAQQKNKQDQLRQLISEGLDAKTNTSTFRIPLGLVGEFKQLIPHGVSQLRRRFGGSSKDIVNEIKRLAPEVDIDMLRS